MALRRGRMVTGATLEAIQEGLTATLDEIVVLKVALGKGDRVYDDALANLTAQLDALSDRFTGWVRLLRNKTGSEGGGW